LTARNLWIANSESNSLTKLRPSDGAALATIELDSSPRAIVSDGTNIWVALSRRGIVKVRPSDGTVVGNFPAGGSPTSVALDGQELWTLNYGDGYLIRLDARDGKMLGVSGLRVPQGPVR